MTDQHDDRTYDRGRADEMLAVVMAAYDRDHAPGPGMYGNEGEARRSTAQHHYETAIVELLVAGGGNFADMPFVVCDNDELYDVSTGTFYRFTGHKWVRCVEAKTENPGSVVEPFVDVVDGEVWALVEQLGHRRLFGRITETTLAGAPMLLVEQPDATGAIKSTVYVSPASLYAVTATTREAVLRHAQTTRALGRYVDDDDEDNPSWRAV